MAVYTKIGEAELKRHLALYDLGELRSYGGIEEGVENSNYRLETDQGLYILTLYEKRVSEKDLPFFMGLLDHLARKGFACPRPQKMKSGEVLGRLEGRPAAIVSFLDGQSVRQPNPQQCERAGHCLAQLHLAAADFGQRRANALDASGWKILADSVRARSDEIEAGLGKLIETQFESVSSQWPQDLPKGVIHGDFFKDNVFFKGEDVCGVIDFYFACNDMPAYDLAIAVNAWCFDKNLAFLEEHYSAFVSGYQSLRTLEADEKRAFAILARGAALRFLLTRAHDWLNAPQDALVVPHDPKEFGARLRFFADWEWRE